MNGKVMDVKMNTKDKIINCPYCKSSFLGDVASNALLHEKVGRYELALQMYADKSNWVRSPGLVYHYCEIGRWVAVEALKKNVIEA